MSERLVTLSVAAVGERLDKLIAAELTELSRTQIQRLIKDGFVTLAGRAVTKAGQRLERPGEIQVRIPPTAPSHHLAEDIPLDIVFENDDLIVVNKPAGMVVHPAAGNWQGTLVNAVLGYDPDLEGVGDPSGQRPGIVHRLDKDTSGLIVVAKNDLAHRDLQRQFQDREVAKFYLALLDGHPPTNTGRIEAPIGRDPKQRQRMAVVLERHGGRPAITEFRVHESFAAHTLVEAHLLTGRTHQIRVHLAYLKCPIVGDTVYGRRKPSLPIERQFLHATRLTFHLPGSGEKKTFEVPLPTELTHLLSLLRG